MTYISKRDEPKALSQMTSQTIKRKLTTIFYADVAGYSRLTRQNEVGTHHQVMSALDHASDAITNNGGTVLRYAGDAILAEFSSIVAAIKIAVDIQQELAKRNTDKSDHDKIQIRVGINLGEVMQDRGEIFGDGVNLAARLESTAQPGGVCISSYVYEQISGKVDVEFIDGGETSFKNINEAGKAAQAVLCIRPNLLLSDIGLCDYFRYEKDQHHLRDALRRAGIPD